MASLLTQKQTLASNIDRGSQLMELNDAGYGSGSTYSTPGGKTSAPSLTKSYAGGGETSIPYRAPTPTSYPSSVTSAPAPAPAPSVASTWTNTGIATNPGSGVVSPPPGGTGVSPTSAPVSQGPSPEELEAQRAAREAELQAALSALEANYNLSREQLLADQTEAGDQYRFLLSALQRSREEGLMAAQSGALQRGILRSGIYLGDEAKVNQQFAAQESQIAADRTAKLNAIQEGIADLEATFAEGRAGTSAGVVQEQLAAMRELAMSLAADNFNIDTVAANAGFKAQPQLTPEQIAASWQTPGAVAAAQVAGRPRLANGAWDMGGGRFMTPNVDGTPSGAIGDGPGPGGGAGNAQWNSPLRATGVGAPAGFMPLAAPQTGGADITSAMFGGMQNTPENRFGAGHLTNNVGLNDPVSGVSQLGTALFGQNTGTLQGQQPINVASWYNSLHPAVQAGLTAQDLSNLASAYPNGIPADVAYNVAQSAAQISGALA